jgi:hypothetical protein
MDEVREYDRFQGEKEWTSVEGTIRVLCFQKGRLKMGSSASKKGKLVGDRPHEACH